MTKNELPEYTLHLITEYYKNNIRPFLDAFSENCIWIGPAEGQMLRTKKTLVEAFSKENNQLTFSMENAEVIPVPLSNKSLDVILTYTVTSFYPNGETTVFHQRTELVWAEDIWKDSSGKTQRDYFIHVCHISNEFPYDKRDTIYPNHFTELDISKIYAGKTDNNHIALKGKYNSFFYLSASSIVYLKCKGTNVLVHTLDKVYEATESITDIVAKYSDTLCRVHSSYAVNPMYVSSIGRFYVMLEDETKIPIPEKKYTKTRDELNRMVDKIRDKEMQE